MRFDYIDGCIDELGMWYRSGTKVYEQKSYAAGTIGYHGFYSLSQFFFFLTPILKDKLKS